MSERPAADWGPSYEAFVAASAALSPAQFLERHRTPHLLVWTETARDPRDPSSMFTTLRLKPLAAQRKTPRAIIGLVKRGGSNAFADMITLGRAANNDVVLPDPTISKFHCYVRRVGDAWNLTDAKSTNGTTVDGKPVEAGGTVTLASGNKVSLGGSFMLEFLEPAALLERVRAR